MRREYENGLALIGAEPSLGKRLEMALQLATLLEQYQAAYLEITRSLQIADDDVLTVRSDLISSEMMDELSAAAEWPRYEGFFERMNEVIGLMPMTRRWGEVKPAQEL
ncbi:hypothetical protein ACVWYQ_006619 [Bradyrhizobium sp. USDA 3397]